jgi:PBP1b-binding outer membrane lipoprotein LpoB
MKKIQIIISILLLTGCCKEPKYLKNGLTTKANKVTEVNLMVNVDSLDIQNIDTISITEKYYNSNNQITKRNENILFDNQTIDIDYFYDNSNRLEKEIVKMSFDTSIVNYFYKDTLLYRTAIKTIHPEFEFEQVTTYNYNRKNKLTETLTSQLYVDLANRDTFLNTEEVSKYNSNKILKESKLSNFVYPKRSKRNLYQYRCGRLLSIENYNDRDSLVSISSFEYIFDEFSNWTEMKTKEGNKLKYIRKREIDYK